MRSFVMAAALTVAGTAAFGQDVRVDFDKNANFGNIKTFHAELGTKWGNPLGEGRVLDEVEQALVAKGWTKAGKDAADAHVMLHGATETQKSLNTFYSGYGGYGFYGWGGGGMGSSTTTVSEYRVGTLVVDIFEAKSKALLFRGVAQDELSDKPEKNKKKAAKASEKMFKNFPPGSKKK